jgi:hypothetical protein
MFSVTEHSFEKYLDILLVNLAKNCKNKINLSIIYNNNNNNKTIA